MDVDPLVSTNSCVINSSRNNNNVIINSSNKAEKKLRKRKELDAMVASKVRKQKHHELLHNISDDTSDDSLKVAHHHHHPDQSGVGDDDRRCRTCHSVCVSLTVMASMVAIITVMWLHIQMKITVDTFRLQLDKVMEEKKSITENHHYYHTQIQELISNQTQVKANISLLHRQYETFSSQLTKLNSSVSSVLTSLENAPELKNLPGQVAEANKNMAKFGSHLTDLDSRVNRLETKLFQDLNNLENNRKQQNNAKDFISKANLTSQVKELIADETNIMKRDLITINEKRKIFATKITEQLKNQENRVAQNLKIMNNLEENVKNVDIQVKSSNDRSKKNEEVIQQILSKRKN